MRKFFSQLLYDEMVVNPDIYVITSDLGYGVFDKIKEDFPDRFFNCGASEQLMIGMAIGLVYQKKIPVVYSITSFLLCRPYELLRTYVNFENIGIKMVGGGRNKEYHVDGFSHFADDAENILDTLENIRRYVPSDLTNLKDEFYKFIYRPYPSFLSLSKRIFN